jgi:hypothetical protein
MKKIGVFVSFLCALGYVEAGTVRLFNDSGYKLRAVVRGADGTYLGEMVITPQASATWTDSLQHYGHNDEANSGLKNATRSQTPYTVVWYCMDGSDFSVSDNISTGAFTQAQQGTGRKSCGGNKPRDTFKDSQQEYIMPDESSSGG